jgi:hypothetical protein
MAIVGGLDLHRKQITLDVLDTNTGEVLRGRISPADRQLFRSWLGGFGDAHVELVRRRSRDLLARDPSPRPTRPASLAPPRPVCRSNPVTGPGSPRPLA